MSDAYQHQQAAKLKAPCYKFEDYGCKCGYCHLCGWREVEHGAANPAKAPEPEEATPEGECPYCWLASGRSGPCEHGIFCPAVPAQVAEPVPTCPFETIEWGCAEDAPLTEPAAQPVSAPSPPNPNTCRYCIKAIRRNRLKQWETLGGSTHCTQSPYSPKAMLMEHEPMDLTQCDGTFRCPICGKDTPHEHSGEEIAEHRAVSAPSPEIPEDKLNALSLEWHGSGYAQKWEDFIFSKLLESYSDNAALTDDLRVAREERDRTQKLHFAYDEEDMQALKQECLSMYQASNYSIKWTTDEALEHAQKNHSSLVEWLFDNLSGTRDDLDREREARKQEAVEQFNAGRKLGREEGIDQMKAE